jgi:hypothetical protein
MSTFKTSNLGRKAKTNPIKEKKKTEAKSSIKKPLGDELKKQI